MISRAKIKESLNHISLPNAWHICLKFKRTGTGTQKDWSMISNFIILIHFTSLRIY
jgi:hypothetical protein